MRFAAAATALSLILAPHASAQLGCEELGELIFEADFDFDEFTGEEVSEGLHQSTYAPEGAQFCVVDYRSGSDLRCMWPFADLPAAQAHFNAQSDVIQTCLTGWAPIANFAVPPTPGRSTLHIMGRAGAGDDAHVQVIQRIDSVAADGQTSFMFLLTVGYRD